MVNMVDLEYITPPDAGSIFGIPVQNRDQAKELWDWALDEANYACTLSARLDGTIAIQLDGVATDTINVVVGGDQWIVFNSGKFILFETAADALLIYKIKGT